MSWWDESPGGARGRRDMHLARLASRPDTVADHVLDVATAFASYLDEHVVDEGDHDDCAPAPAPADEPSEPRDARAQDDDDDFDDALPAPFPLAAHMDEALLSDPGFDEGLRRAMPDLEEVLGEAVDRFVVILRDHAGRTVRRAADEGWRDLQVFAIPVLGFADDIDAALGNDVGLAGLASSLVDHGVVARRARLSLLDGLVPLDGLNLAGPGAIRRALDILDDDRLEPRTALEALQGTPVSDIPRSDDGSGGTFVTRAVVGMRSLPWKATHDAIDELSALPASTGMGEDGSDPTSAWQSWASDTYGARGVVIGVPQSLTQAGCDLGVMRIEHYLAAQSGHLGLSPDQDPDETMVLIDDERVAMALVYPDGVLVGPVDVPIECALRDPEQFRELIEDVSAGEVRDFVDGEAFDAAIEALAPGMEADAPKGPTAEVIDLASRRPQGRVVTP